MELPIYCLQCGVTRECGTTSRYSCWVTTTYRCTTYCSIDTIYNEVFTYRASLGCGWIIVFSVCGSVIIIVKSYSDLFVV